MTMRTPTQEKHSTPPRYCRSVLGYVHVFECENCWKYQVWEEGSTEKQCYDELEAAPDSRHEPEDG